MKIHIDRSDYSSIKPYHFFGNEQEKIKLNWFAFELASELDKAVPYKLKKYLSKQGYTKESFNQSCIHLAKLLQAIALENLLNQRKAMDIRYTEVEKAFPHLNDRTINKLLDCTSVAWENLLSGCVICPSACLSNKNEKCTMFDDAFYYQDQP